MARYVVEVEDKASKPAEAAASSVSQLGATLGGLKGLLGAIGGPVSSAASSLEGLGTSLAGAGTSAASFGASAGPAGLAIAAIVTVAAAGALAVAGLTAALWELAGAALAVAARRSALFATFDALTEGAGRKAVGALAELSERLPFSTSEINKWGKGLAQAGIQDAGALQKGALAAASAAALLGDQTGEVAGSAVSLIGKLTSLAQVGASVKLDNKLLRSLREVGLSANDLAVQLGTTPDKLRNIGVSAEKMSTAVQDALIRKGKAPLEEMGFTWDAIKKKVSEGIGIDALVKDLAPAIRPFMAELRSFAEEFFKGSIAANVAKGAVTGVMTALFQLATKALVEVHVGFLQLENYALRAAIAVAPTVLWLRRMWAEHDGAGKMITVLKGVGVALAVIAAGAAVAFIPIAIAVGASLAAFAALSLAIGYVVENVGAAKDAVVGWASSAYDAASQFVDGLVAGIKNGVASVIQAASDLASGAVDAVKGILQIQSPSRVMLEVGSNTARGMAAGIDEGAPDVADASRGLGVAAASGPAAIRRAGGAGRGGTKAPTIQITINGNVDEGVFNVLETRLAEVVERVVGRSGLLEPEPAGP